MTASVQPTSAAKAGRNPLWDITRGLGMVFVVAGHGFGGNIDRFVSLFHIPLFFFISGLVFKFGGRSFSNVAVFLRKSLKTLWWPCVLYGSGFVLMHNLFVRWGLYDLPSYGWSQTGAALARHVAFGKTEPPEAAMWFLLALFVGRCLLYVVSWTSSCIPEIFSRSRLAVELALVGLAFAVGCTAFYLRLDPPGHVDVACSLLPFLYAGFKLKRVDLVRPWMVLAGLALLVLVFVFDTRTLLMSRNRIVSPFFLLITSGAGIASTFGAAAALLFCSPVAKALAFVGRHTIPVICLHLIAFRAVSWIWMTIDGLPSTALAKHPIIAPSLAWGTLYTAVGVLFPLAIPALGSLSQKFGRTSP